MGRLGDLVIMMKSELHQGLIYAGDSPLASTITVEQTGPMQLTVRAGSFTTTGQARLRPYVPADHDPIIVQGKAEKLADGTRVRLWIQKANGTPLESAKTYALAANQIITVTSDPLAAVTYTIDLITDDLVAAVLVKRKLVEVEKYGPPPAGWHKIHELLFEFILPPGTTDLAGLTMYVLTVKPGFPPGTGPADWQTQTG